MSLDWIDDELQTLAALGLRRHATERSGAQQAVVTMDGQTYVNFGSNDYLGLAASAEVTAAVRTALDECGWGSGASPLVTGRDSHHARLEAELADFEGTAAALLFPSGFAANVGAVTALAGRGDLILSDAKNHASLIDGCRLSGARIQIYPHGDMEVLEHFLKQAGSFRRRLLVTDSLFSMDGDLAPLDRLAALAERYRAMLLVDEAHATGVLGEQGRGACELFGVEEYVTARVGTLSKALGSSGGFVVGSRSLIDWLANRARSYVFSTAAPGPCAAAGLAALEVVRREPERRRRLLAAATELRHLLARDGWQTGASRSQIIPLFIGTPQRTVELAQQLRTRGFWVPGIRPPTVPDGESLLRISLTCEHTLEQREALRAALRSLVTSAPH
ncbi:MAG: 8-amino-7-oxononanoate synthase [Pirellulales bacterium]